MLIFSIFPHALNRVLGQQFNSNKLLVSKVSIIIGSYFYDSNFLNLFSYTKQGLKVVIFGF